MRKIRHLTPRYILNRSLEKIYRYRNPGVPWLTKTANSILETYLQKSDRGLEFGSGYSTIWFAKRMGTLTSVEHNPGWYQKVTAMLAEHHLENVHYLLREQDTGVASPESAYVRAAETLDDESLDFVLVDGIHRDASALASLPKLKPGAVMVVDNVNLYLPCSSKAPNSRTSHDGPRNAGWSQFYETVKAWRTIWTSNGVSDTAFFFKEV